MPRLRLFFSGDRNDQNCHPIQDCAQRDELITSIERLRFNDSHEDAMSCAHHGNTYALLCRGFYDIHMGSTEGAQADILWIVVLVSLVIIFCLLLNTVRLTQKLKKIQAERSAIKEQNNLNGGSPEQIEMIPDERQ